MFKLDDGKSPLLVLNSKRPALTYELEQKHDAKWIARVTIGQEQFSGEGYKKNIAKGLYSFLSLIHLKMIENLFRIMYNKNIIFSSITLVYNQFISYPYKINPMTVLLDILYIVGWVSSVTQE